MPHRYKKWRDAMQAASSKEAVVSVVREYVTSLPSDVLRALPDECQRVLSVESTADIQVAAVTLLHCELGYNGQPETFDVLHEIAHTFAVASMRLTSLGGKAFSPDPASS